jgi:hypothetical protein
MGTNPDQPERPTLDTGPLYIYSEEDISRAMGELWTVVREYDNVDDRQAAAVADYCYDLLTGDFTTDDDRRS